MNEEVLIALYSEMLEHRMKCKNDFWRRFRRMNIPERMSDGMLDRFQGKLNGFDESLDLIGKYVDKAQMEETPCMK